MYLNLLLNTLPFSIVMLVFGGVSKIHENPQCLAIGSSKIWEMTLARPLKMDTWETFLLKYDLFSGTMRVSGLYLLT